MKQKTYKIVTFGDSTTAPRPEDDLFVYSDILQQQLPDSGINAEIINKGIGGNNTNDAIARFDQDVLAQNPDLVVIQFGINDAAVDVWQDPPATQSRVSLVDYRANLTHMIHSLKAAGSKIILMTSNALRWTHELLSMYGKPPYNPDDSMGFNLTMTDYIQAVRDIAATEKLELIDIYAQYLAYDQQPNQSMDDLLLDGMHPNNQGQKLVANAIKPIIIAQLAG